MRATGAWVMAAALSAAAMAGDEAEGAWKKIHSQGGDYLVAVSLTADGHLFAGGFTLDQASQLPLPTPALYASDDGGKTLESILGSLGGGADNPFGAVAAIEAVEFVDGSSGWVAIDKKVHRTTDRGATWTESDPGGTVTRMHFFDAKRGVAVGKGGFAAWTDDGAQSWTAAPTGTQAELRCMFWVDGLRGWAAGHGSVSETDFDGNESTTVDAGVVLFTTDGGRSWTQGFTTAGHTLCPLVMLPDGRTGFLASSDKSGGDNGTAHLWRTGDGGVTFEDMALPQDLGTLDMFIKVPIHASGIAAMAWADAQTGHLGGSAYLSDSSSGMGGSTPVYKIVDFVTRDGGATWEKTDLGTVKIDLMGGQAPSGDGTIIDGAMSSLLDGFMVGDGGAVWRYEGACTADADCGAGARCTNGGCETVQAAGPCEGTVCNEATAAAAAGGAGGAGDASGAGGGGGAGGAGTAGGGAAADGATDGGCGATGGPPAALALALLALLALPLRRLRTATETTR